MGFIYTSSSGPVRPRRAEVCDSVITSHHHMTLYSFINGKTTSSQRRSFATRCFLSFKLELTVEITFLLETHTHTYTQITAWMHWNSNSAGFGPKEPRWKRKREGMRCSERRHCFLLQWWATSLLQVWAVERCHAVAAGGREAPPPWPIYHHRQTPIISRCEPAYYYDSKTNVDVWNQRSTQLLT